MGRHALVICPCGRQFEASERRLARGRDRYCGKECMYRFRLRPSGLTYRITRPNPTSFATGHTRHPRGEGSWLWRGNDIGYKELHRWVRRELGAPGACAACGSTEYTEWANRSHEYHRDRLDWISLCRLCHRQHDSGPNRGLAVAKYGREGVRG